MGTMLVILGGVVFLIGWVMLLVEAFGTGVLWGLGCLLCFAIVGPLFAFLNWGQAKKGFLLQLAGAALVVTGWLLGPGVT
jgi:hypothetical protein